MPTSKVNLNSDWKLRQALKEIVNKNCVEVPYEGTSVNRENIVDMFLSFLQENHYSILRHENAKGQK